jgi:hypothetical protein
MADKETPDQTLDLMVKLPSVYQSTFHPLYNAEIIHGDEVEAILDAAAERGHLNLPMSDLPVKHALARAWKCYCKEVELPYIVVEIDALWGGSIEYDLRPMGAKIPSIPFQLFCHELNDYHASCVGKVSNLLLSMLYRVAPTDGTILFTASRYDAVQLVLGYILEVRNRCWVEQAPVNPKDVDEQIEQSGPDDGPTEAR